MPVPNASPSDPAATDIPSEPSPEPDRSISGGGLTIATWNVNSINARLNAVLDWVDRSRPDVLCLQEIKCETERFPAESFRALGYDAKVVGQKSYNGVAIIHRPPATDVISELPGDGNDAHARYIEATVSGVRIICLYAPNGNPVVDAGLPSEKYRYKLAWLARLQDRLVTLMKAGAPVVACGDYNVIPRPVDCYDPEAWKSDALFLPETRQAFRRIEHSGYYDAFRALHPDQTGAYTFWDYQRGAWQHNHGIRIDHALLSPQAADRLERAWIDVEPRGREKASDHTPFLISLR